MTRLGILHRRLASLRRIRALGRWATAYAGLATAILWLLLAVFAIDVAFQMDVLQRVVIIGLAVVGGLWSVRRLALPELGIREDEIELALLVERQQRISSDLVAAIQFERPEAAAWGSQQLEQHVIQSVAELTNRMDVFEGFSQAKPRHRLAWLALTLVVTSGVAICFPDHTRAFLQRLMLASVHYPSATVIERIAINHRLVLERRRDGAGPLDARFAEGYPLEFWVRCGGVLAPDARVELRTGDDQVRSLDLSLRTLDERRERLAQAVRNLREALAANEVDLAGIWARDTAMLVRIDAAETADVIESAAGDAARLRQAADRLDQLLAAWPAEAATTAVYAGRLPRLVSPLAYQVYVGDGWTDPARVAMMALPIIESRLNVIPPSYARIAPRSSTDSTVRHISVLEGSRVQVAIKSVNQKRLDAAWLTILGPGTTRRYDLAATDDTQRSWELTDESSFDRVVEPLRFEIQVTDEDGLQLETPLRGYVRLKPDRPPTCAAAVVHSVVLPNAKPKIEYRVNDDYGVGRIRLHIAVERATPDPIADAPSAASSAAVSEAPAEDTSLERQTLTLLDETQPVLADRLPIEASYVLDLAALRIGRGGVVQTANLAKGDRLRLTLEAVDYRGEAPGESYQSDPLILEISDEAGVLAAISQADEKSEQRLTDIIRQQLEIGGGR